MNYSGNFTERNFIKLTLKNRSRIEILYDVIVAAKPFSKKTHLMYRGNLSYQQLDLYLDFILRNGLLVEKYDDYEGRLYFITKKGEEFVRLFEDMHELIKPGRVQTSYSEAPRSAAKPLESAPNPQASASTSFVY